MSISLIYFSFLIKFSIIILMKNSKKSLSRLSLSLSCRAGNRKISAFTLIELLVVIAIIGILSGLVFVSMSGAINSANDAKRKANIDSIRKAVMMYSANSGAYPIQATLCTIGGGATPCSVLATALIPNYFTAFPQDPVSGYYTYISDGTNFTIAATLSDTRAYALNSSTGTCEAVSYGGKIYNTVVIGTQCWLRENLDIGTMIASPATMPTNNGIIEKWCNGADGNGHTTSGSCSTYGGLYSWDEAMGYVTTPGVQGICPPGWHIPTHDEWTTLERAINGSTAFPYDATTTGWLGTNEGSKLSLLTSGGTNSTGFTALLPGYRNTDGTFHSRSVNTYLWSSTDSGGSAWRRSLYSSEARVNRSSYAKAYGFSVRCLKN